MQIVEVEGMPISPEKWIDLLKLYGPMALFVFMVFVLLRRAHATENLTTAQKKVQDVAFSLVWVSIFLLAGMIVFAWWRVNFPSEVVLSGTISHLQYPESISTDQLYLRRRIVALPEFEFDWRLIGPPPPSGKIVLQLQKNPKASDCLTYEVPIRSDFSQGLLQIDYDRQTDRMSITHGSHKEEISGKAERFPGERSAVVDLQPNSLGPGLVYADSPPKAKPEDLVRTLDADDPLLRQRARSDLIALGQRAIPTIEQTLTDPSAPYRMRVGVLSALKEMSQQAKQLLHEPARCAIAKMAEDPDGTLRAEAAGVIASGVAVSSTCPIASKAESSPGCTSGGAEPGRATPGTTSASLGSEWGAV